MKKILLLLTMVLTCVGAWAQTFTAPEVGKFYIIKGDNGTYPWLTANTNSSGSVQVSNSEANAAVFERTANGLKAVATGKYLGYSNGKYTYSDSQIAVQIVNTGDQANSEGKYAIKSGNNWMYNNNTDGIVHETSAWDRNLERFWGFIEVANPDGIVDGVYTINNIYNGRGTLAYGTYSGSEYLGLSDVTLSGCTGNKVTVSADANQQWCVVTTENGTFFYNVGKGYFLQKSVSGNNTSVVCNATAPETGLTYEKRTANNTVFLSVKNSNYYLTFACGYAPSANPGQVRWNTADEAAATLLTFKRVSGDHSAIINTVKKKLYPNTAAKNALGTAITNAETYFENTPIGTGVGKYSSSIENYNQEFYEVIKPFYNAITDDTEISAIGEKTARVAEILASFTLNMPVQGKFYRIAYDYGGEVGKLYLQSTNSSVRGLEFANADGASSIWYYDGALMSYDKGKYIKETGNTRGLQNIGTKQEVTFTASTRVNARYNIAVTSYIHAYNENGNYFADHCGDDGGHTTHDLILEEVTYLPVSISAADYSTLYSPVALEVTGGVKAYTITVNGEWARLNEITDNVIPANTGVVLYHNNDATEHYDFVITSVDSNVETSPLTGTFAATYVEETAYVLANGTNGVGFYIADMNQEGNTKFLNNAFKAYLPETAVTSGVKALRFTFGETTAIETVETENANAPIYDLSGRRVLSTVKGGIYIQNGKKFIVK